MVQLRIKELCKEKGITLNQLADKLGITRITLTRNISGNPTLSTLVNIAAALGVSVLDLFAPQPTNTITCPKCGTVLEVKEK